MAFNMKFTQARLALVVLILIVPIFMGATEAKADTTTSTTYNSFTYPMQMMRLGFGFQNGIYYTEFDMRLSLATKVGLTFRAVYQGSSQQDAKIEITKLSIFAGIHPDWIASTQNLRIKINYTDSNGVVRYETILNSVSINYPLTTSADNWRTYVGWSYYSNVLSSNYKTTFSMDKNSKFQLSIERYNPPAWESSPIQMRSAHFSILNDPNNDFELGKVALFHTTPDSYQGIRYSTGLWQYMEDRAYDFDVPSYPTSGGGGGGGGGWI